jgi:tetratricopeptide (TPR) repeat protein
LVDLGRLDESLEAYDALYLCDYPVALNGKASALKQLGRFDEALKVASRAIELVPTDPIARCNYADILSAKGDYAAALQVYLDVQLSIL